MAVSIGALAVSGCGATAATEPAQQSAPQAGGNAVEPTDGRLGDATALRDGGPQRRLSSGGPLDARRHGGSARHRDGVGAGAACPNPDPVPSAESLAAMSDATLCLLNGERADHGLAPLTSNGALANAATAYAQDLVAGSYFSHTGRDGSGVLDRIERSGYLPRDAGWALGENLAWGTGSLATPGSIMQAWMNSPGHRGNILSPDYREIGIGIVTGNPAAADGLGATYATEFGVIEGLEGADDSESVRVADRRQRAGRSRARARRRAKARHARRVHRAHQARRAGRGRGLAGGERRGSVAGIKAQIAT